MSSSRKNITIGDCHVGNCWGPTDAPSFTPPPSSATEETAGIQGASLQGPPPPPPAQTPSTSWLASLLQRRTLAVAQPFPQDPGGGAALSTGPQRWRSPFRRTPAVAQPFPQDPESPEGPLPPPSASQVCTPAYHEEGNQDCIFVKLSRLTFICMYTPYPNVLFAPNIKSFLIMIASCVQST